LGKNGVGIFFFSLNFFNVPYYMYLFFPVSYISMAGLSESRHLMAAPILLSLKFLCLWSFTFVYLDSVCYYRVCEWFVHVFSVVLRLYLGANISY
jgi:hypothetical protein